MSKLFRVVQVVIGGFLWLVFAHASWAASDPYEYEVKSVKYKNLVASLYLPKSEGRVPVVIAFGGSDGGIGFGDANGKMIAPSGVAVLALAYFKEDGLPKTLDDIPLEYFVQAIDYVQTVTSIDASRIGVVSGSRGSEAAFLLASMDDRIKSLAVTTPSYVSWGGTKSDSAWTIGGVAVPALSLKLDDTISKLNRYRTALENKDAVEIATFHMEKINGPIFIISAKNDQVWPSYDMSVAIEAYLARHKFKHSVTHASYLTGHGFSSESAPAIKRSIVDHFLRTL